MEAPEGLEVAEGAPEATISIADDSAPLAPDSARAEAPASPSPSSASAAVSPAAVTTPSGASSSSYLVDANNDPVLLRGRVEKYKEVLARLKLAHKETLQQLATLTQRCHTLQSVADVLDSSILARKTADGSPDFQIVARVSLPLSSPHLSSAASHAQWVCLSCSNTNPDTVDSTPFLQEWHRQETVTAAFPTLSSPLSSTPLFSSPDETAALRARVNDITEELRRYRVKTEALLRQRDAEVAAEREKALAAESQRILSPSHAASAMNSPTSVASGDGKMSGDGLQQRVLELSAQVERLVRWQGEAREREGSLRDKIASLSHELDGRVAHASGGTSLISEPSNNSSSSADRVRMEAFQTQLNDALEEKDKLSTEFNAYRRRTLAMVKERDDQVSKLASDLSTARKQLRTLKIGLSNVGLDATKILMEDDSGATQPTSQHTLEGSVAPPASTATATTPASKGVLASPGSGPSMSASHEGLPSLPQWEYLKNILVRYLSAPASEERVRAQLEPAIMAVLGLSQVEVAGVKKSNGRVPGALPATTSSPMTMEVPRADAIVSSFISSASSWLGLEPAR
jgi:hypothetical protein